MPGSTSDRLDKRLLTTKKPFLICVHDSDQAYFRKIKPFTQQINADKYIILASTEATKDISTLQCVDITVDISGFDANLLQVCSKIFGHTLRQRRHQDSLILRNSVINFSD